MINRFILKITIKFFLIFFFIFSAYAFAEKNNWVSVGVINNELWFVDIDSISCEANSCKVWVKILSRTSAKRLPLESEGYTKSLFDYNCTWMEYRIIETTRYDSSGHVIKSTLTKDMNKKYKIHEPMDKQFHDLVCQKVEPQKEQKKRVQVYDEKKPVQEKSNKVTEEAKNEIIKKPLKKLSKPPEVLKTVFTVQVGAFKNVSYAQSLKKVLNKKGYHTYIILTKKKGNLYKVFIGRFSDRKKAKALAEKIKNTEGCQAFVTTW